MKIYFISILSFLILFKSYSQDSNTIDSLKKVISNVEKKCPVPCPEDTSRILAYIGLGEEIFVDYPDSAISLWTEAEKIARNLLARKNTSKITETTNKCLALAINNIGYVYKYMGEIPKALVNYNKALKIQEEVNDLEGVSNTYINIGVIYNNQGDITKALEYFLKSLKIKKQINDKSGMSIVINNIGTIYDDQGDIAKALEYYHKGLNLYEEMGNKKGMALALNNIGYIYYNQADIKNALDYFYKSLELRTEIGDNQGVAITLNNMGLIYNNMSDDAYLQQNIKRRDSLLELSIEYCQKSLKIREESGYKQDMASSLYNLARFYKQQNQILKFKIFSERSYKISKELGFPEDIGNSASLMREIAVMNGDYKKAYEYYQEQMNMKDSVQNEQNYRQTQQQQARYTYQKQSAIDSIAHDKAIQIKNLELAKTEQEKEKQQIVIYSFVLGFAIILIFSILLLRLFLQKKKANQLLAKQNAEISQQKEEIESQRDEIESQRDQVMGQKEQIEELYEIAVERKNIVEAQQVEIHDSIRYAKRIQHAVLPDFSRLFTIVEDSKQFSVSINKKTENRLPIVDYFVLFKPKDIVSGDFYWATKTEDWTIITVADCTGHGVPGAFMSMLGVSFLNEIVRRKEVTDAAMVLNQLRSAIIDALGQTGEEGTQKDGMDMSIIAIRNQPQSSKPQNKESNQYSVSSKLSANNDFNQRNQNNQSKISGSDIFQAQWAGANNPLWIIKSPKSQIQSPKIQELETLPNSLDLELEACFLELKADKMPIAIYEKMESFINHELQLQKGDILYLMSDGYQDQFGGPKQKKFLSKNLKQLLIANCQLPMDEQKQVLEKTLIEWIGDGEQIDDITVVGIKII